MASLPYEMLFLTTSNTVVVKDLDQACYRIHDKATDAAVSGDPIVRDSRKALQDAKGIPWKLQGRLKDSLRELENLQEKERCLAVTWIATGVLAMLFGNGAICLLYLKGWSLQKITIDRSLCEKFGDRAVHAIITARTIAIAFHEPKVMLIRFSRPLHQRSQRRSALGEARVTAFETVGVAGRKWDRRVAWSPTRSWLLVFWGAAQNEAVPWSPLLTEKNRANVLVYTILESNAIELFCYGRIDRDIHAAELSDHVSNNLITVEDGADESGSSAQVCIYQVGQGRFVRLSCVSVSLGSPMISCAMHQPLQKLLISTRSNGLVCYDGVRRTVESRKLTITADRIRWHPGGAFAVLVSNQGKLLCVDIALNVLPLQALSDVPLSHTLLDLNPFFRHKPSALCLEWEPQETPQSNNLGALIIDRTCVLLINFQLGSVTATQNELWGPVALSELYLRQMNIEAALNVLRSLSWLEYASICYRILLKFCNRLLSHNLTDQVENFLEQAMSSFFCESGLLEQNILEQYMPRVVNLARRFFFQLLRYGKYEKAFLLAVDIESIDLFHDLTTIAKKFHLSGLLQASLRKIDELESSTCTSSSSSQSTSDRNSDESESSSDNELDWSRAELFVQVEPTQVKVAAATPTRQLVSASGSLPRTNSSARGIPALKPARMNQSFESALSSRSPATGKKVEDVDVDEEQTRLAKGVECIYFGKV